MIYGYVYCITNTLNNKQYVGLTTRSTRDRFEEHTKADSGIGMAIRKYGVSNFKLETLERCSDDMELCQREIYWIDRLNTFKYGYNQTIGGEGVNLNHPIEPRLTNEQQGYIDWVLNENKKPIDISNAQQMVSSLIINAIERYLSSRRINDKKITAKHILNFKSKYINAITDLDIIDFEELEEYAS